MKFYRSLRPFQVISFDLDDTLYDNSQVIIEAERHCIEFLRQSADIALDGEKWNACRQQIAQQQPRLCEDVTAWRIETIQTLLRQANKRPEEIRLICNRTMQAFLQRRHAIRLPQQSMDILNRLKKRVKLAALTNGNLEPARIGLNQFDLVLQGGKQGRAKPHADLFRQTAAYFNVPTHQILHIGDNLITDVQGAVQAGCQSVWINLSGRNLNFFPEAGLLPDLEIDDLGALLKL
ncbi:HAD-IA family hydrolase [Mesocricetibacter intestinalis]|nr:HAD-IA family hydrolase [Mesocricetibacter intestinalis]